MSTRGPFRGGRSTAVAGTADEPYTFYFGSTGGGVWRSADAGNSWENISDGYFGGSIGAVAVSSADNNIIYADGQDNFCIDRQSGSVMSDYNNLFAVNGAWIGSYNGNNWEHLVYWQNDAGLDENSISVDPLFASP